MTKHKKELQRYFAKWVLMFILIALVATGIIGYFMKIEDNSIILVMLAEVASLLAVFFGFNMKSEVQVEQKEDEYLGEG